MSSSLTSALDLKAGHSTASKTTVNYEVGNVRWATVEQQLSNRRTTLTKETHEHH